PGLLVSAPLAHHGGDRRAAQRGDSLSRTTGRRQRRSHRSVLRQFLAAVDGRRDSQSIEWRDLAEYHPAALRQTRVLRTNHARRRPIDSSWSSAQSRWQTGTTSAPARRTALSRSSSRVSVLPGSPLGSSTRASNTRPSAAVTVTLPIQRA